MVIALIPARSGSTRVKRKNTRTLGEHPLLAYTIAQAQESLLFDGIYVSSDDAWTLAVAAHYGASPIECPLSIAHDHDDPDIKWVTHALEDLRCRPETIVAILRPTSPFRTVGFVREGYAALSIGYDSVRAMRRVREHPGKMWVPDVEHAPAMRPLLGAGAYGPVTRAHVPWHSSPTQVLPPVYVQTSSLEWTRVSVIRSTGTISGTLVKGLICDGPDAFSIDTEDDWRTAERWLAEGAARVPPISQPALSPTAQI